MKNLAQVGEENVYMTVGKGTGQCTKKIILLENVVQPIKEYLPHETPVLSDTMA
jgi:hypothetical protein